MTLSITGFNSRRFADIKSISASGLPGCGNYILYIRLSALVDKLDSNADLSQLACRIEVGDSNLRCANGDLEGRPVITWHEFTNDTDLGFLFYLNGSQLNTIEKVRDSGDLKMGVWLSGEITYKETSTTFMDRGAFVIPKQEWLEALGRMNYKSTLLFELPMPGEHANSELRQTLERAQSHLLNGHYQESVGLCRKAIELIEKISGDKASAKSAISKFKEDREGMSVIERMLFLREALKNITHLGAHHSDDFSRNQAQAILGMTVALLSCPEIGIRL